MHLQIALPQALVKKAKAPGWEMHGLCSTMASSLRPDSLGPRDLASAAPQGFPVTLPGRGAGSHWEVLGAIRLESDQGALSHFTWHPVNPKAPS